jgi:FlaG protein
MNIDVSPLGPLGPLRPTAGTGEVPSTQRAPDAFATALESAVSVDIGAIPASPPPEVMRDVARAAERMEWLREHNRELRFRIDEESGRVHVEMRDLEGRLIREVPSSTALDHTSPGSFE